MPAPAIDDTMKNAKNNRIGRDSSWRISARNPAGRAPFSRFCSLRMRLCNTIASTTGTPTPPTSSSVSRQPISSISAAVTGGAAANPILPTKVCSANDRPRRDLSTEPAQDRVIGRVDDRVAEPRQHRQQRRSANTRWPAPSPRSTASSGWCRRSESGARRSDRRETRPAPAPPPRCRPSARSRGPSSANDTSNACCQAMNSGGRQSW